MKKEDDEERLLREFRALPEKGRQRVLKLVDTLTEAAAKRARRGRPVAFPKFCGAVLARKLVNEYAVTVKAACIAAAKSVGSKEFRQPITDGNPKAMAKWCATVARCYSELVEQPGDGSVRLYTTSGNCIALVSISDGYVEDALAYSEGVPSAAKPPFLIIGVYLTEKGNK